MGLWTRIKEAALTDVGVLVKGIDQDAIEAVERTLLEADFGPATFPLVEDLERQVRRGALKDEAAFRRWLIGQVESMFTAGAAPPVDDTGLAASASGEPTVVLLLGVNGAGKTTQAAKLAHRCRERNRSVLLAAADTFRAGATEQLREWGERLGVRVVGGTPGGDPAAVAFDAVEAGVAQGIDVVIVDTAGRLHTEGDLVIELQKIDRVIGRRSPGAPQERLLVLDGTVGQNAAQQGRVFADALPLTGLVVTKLDGTAKGGAVVAVHRELGVPIRFVGLGEGIEDLEPFAPGRFAERLLES